MRFGFGPGASSNWDETLELCRHAETSGWDAIWYADHFMPNVADPAGPTNESWTFVSPIAATCRGCGSAIWSTATRTATHR